MNFFNNLNVRTKIVLLFLIFSLISSLLVVGVFGFILTENIVNNSLNELSLNTNNVSNHIGIQDRLVRDNIFVLQREILSDFNFDIALTDKNYRLTHIENNHEKMKNLLSFLNNSGVDAVSIYFDYSVERFGEVNSVWFIFEEGEVKLYDGEENYTLSDFYSQNPLVQWYYLPKQTREGAWTSVYFDEYLEKKMISYTVPLIDSNNRFFGVLGVDLSLETEESFVKIANMTNIGEIFVLDKENNYIVTPKKIPSQFLMNNLRNEIEKNTIGFVFGEEKIMFYQKTMSNKIVVNIIERSFIDDQVNQVWLLTIVLILLLVFLFSYPVIKVLNKITLGIDDLNLVAKELNKGNFSVRSKIKTGDDIEELGNSFNKAIEALSTLDMQRKELDKAKTEFLSITSHELRSPMTPMRAQLQMLLKGYFGKVNKKQKESLEIVLRNTERLDKIIQDFLEISRIESARLKFNFVKTNLEKPIKDVFEEMKGFLPEKKIKFSLEMDSLPNFEVDPDRTMQVLRNLLNNAIKFAPFDGKGKIDLIIKRGEDGLLFVVKDNGFGVSPQNKQRLFEPFFQEEQTMYRKYSGTGLGLAICKGIIESQKGKIWLESKGKNKGTTFYFTVPYKPVKEIAPIKVLFSQKSFNEEKIKNIFAEYLGPLGENEFNLLAEKTDLKILMDEVRFMMGAKIINKETGEKMMGDLKEIFENDFSDDLTSEKLKNELNYHSNDEGKIDEDDLSKKGFLK